MLCKPFIFWYRTIYIYCKVTGDSSISVPFFPNILSSKFEGRSVKSSELLHHFTMYASPVVVYDSSWCFYYFMLPGQLDFSQKEVNSNHIFCLSIDLEICYFTISFAKFQW